MKILEFSLEFKRKLSADGADYKTIKTYNNHACLLMEFYKIKYSSPLFITTLDIENYMIIDGQVV